MRRELGEQKVYSLAQGPITLDYTNAYKQEDEKISADKSGTEGKLSNFTTMFLNLTVGEKTSILVRSIYSEMEIEILDW